MNDEVDPIRMQVLVAMGKLRSALVALVEFDARVQEAKDTLTLLDMDSNNLHLHMAYRVTQAVGVFLSQERMRLLEATDELKIYLEGL